jgi:hypothetical protein
MNTSREFDRITPFLAALVLGTTSSIGATDSFAQSELTTAGSTQN